MSSFFVGMFHVVRAALPAERGNASRHTLGPPGDDGEAKDGEPGGPFRTRLR